MTGDRLYPRFHWWPPRFVRKLMPGDRCLRCGHLKKAITLYRRRVGSWAYPCLTAPSTGRPSRTHQWRTT